MTTTELALTDPSGTLDAPTAKRAIDGFIAALAAAERPDMDRLEAALEAAAAWVSKLLKDSLDVHVSLMFAKRAFYTRARELGVLSRYVHKNYACYAHAAIDAVEADFERIARVSTTFLNIGRDLRYEKVQEITEADRAAQRAEYRRQLRRRLATRKGQIKESEQASVGDAPASTWRVETALDYLRVLTMDRCFPINLPHLVFFPDWEKTLYQSTMRELDGQLDRLSASVDVLREVVDELRANANLIRDRVGDKTIGEALTPNEEQLLAALEAEGEL